MVPKIQKDHQRFRQIVKGKIREDLRKFLTRGELIGKEGKHLISIPVRGIELPNFRYGDNDDAGVGSGEGQVGNPVDGDAEGIGPGGTEPGNHILEVDISLAELADILGEELQLPRIEPKGKHTISAEKDRYSGIRQSGPESLRHFKRTFKQALRRQLMSGTYDPDRPIIIPIRQDRRYRSWKTVLKPQSNAVIIYMMDVSGSMGNEQKELVRLEAFWIDAWLRRNYEGIESRYIVHDVRAYEVDKHTFYHVREDGGTKISSAYELCLKQIKENYPPDEWNIYPFHFSDGDNWSARDSEHCICLLKEQILPACNQFCYGQVKSAYGSGQFKKDLDASLSKEEGFVTTDILDRDGILPSIKAFLGKGR